MEGRATIYFEDPFWVGAFERSDGAGYAVARFWPGRISIPGFQPAGTGTGGINRRGGVQTAPARVAQRDTTAGCRNVRAAHAPDGT